MADYAALLPVNLVTGFLGSGKTTLLNRLLRAPQLARTAVLVNEFGAVGLDHLQGHDAETVLLPSGCVCCTIRGDLAEAIRSLFSRRERGIIPSFDRLAIETTGLADRRHDRLDAARRAGAPASRPPRQRDRHGRCGERRAPAAEYPRIGEAGRDRRSHRADQDRDLAEARPVAQLKAALERLNPTAPILDAASDALAPDELMASDVYNPTHRSAEVRRWLDEEDRATTACITTTRTGTIAPSMPFA